MSDAAEGQEWKLVFVELETGHWELRREETNESLAIFVDLDEALIYGFMLFEEPEVRELTFRRAQKGS